MSSDNLPEIPKEWNLTDAQRASMIAAQKKTVDSDNKRRALQQENFNNFNQHSSMTPPEYPIVVIIKENNKITQQINLIDSNQKFIYAQSFEDATTKVKNEINNPNSNLVQQYKKNGQGKLRISSDNKKGPPQTNNFSLIPNSNYKYWQITATNAPSSLLSSFRKTIQSKGGRKTKRKTKRKINKHIKKTKSNKSKISKKK
jgi:glycerophosphoryl diester phosphodiesterase